MKFRYKILFAIGYWLLSIGFIKSQNLVNNGYFEQHTNCSNTLINNATGWHISTLTPDYYNACWGTSSGSDVPYADIGFQYDCCGGVAYAGGFMFDKNSPNNDRDYIYAKLVDTLKAGHKYVAGMYVSRGEAVDYAISTMGILFTDTVTVLPSGQGFISASPQIKSTTLLDDTMNWMLVQDTFIAVGNEVYLTIGNFNTDATSDTVKLTNYWPSFPISYYYIDNVSVYDVATMGIEQTKNKQQNINLYPNPSNGNMFVDYNITKDAMIEIMDINGSLVSKYNLPANNTKLDIHNENLPNGVYLYRVLGEKVTTGRFVIMK